MRNCVALHEPSAIMVLYIMSVTCAWQRQKAKEAAKAASAAAAAKQDVAEYTNHPSEPPAGPSRGWRVFPGPPSTPHSTGKRPCLAVDQQAQGNKTPEEASTCSHAHQEYHPGTRTPIH